MTLSKRNTPVHLADPITQPQFYRDVAGKRLMAWVVDTILVVLICLLILPFTAFVAIFFFFGLIGVVGFVYRVITLATGSATWGMRLMAIEIRDATGARLDLGQAFLHTLGYTISWAVPPLQLVSIVLMATSNRGQGLTDMVLGTAALNRRAHA
ncbi:RDD family protein [uncultured Tateyamaria sp.]|uniref:RDD family protein n=1 Tax=uncultured Tateyamaria sp. TaxID=455651 RepID=UPI0026070666|nr:RDD family protein [uncultured Tateyamaria sp.]